MYDQGQLATYGERVDLAYNLCQGDQALNAPVSLGDVDSWIEALFVIQHLLKTISGLAVQEDGASGGNDHIVSQASLGDSRLVVWRFAQKLFSLLWDCIRSVV